MVKKNCMNTSKCFAATALGLSLALQTSASLSAAGSYVVVDTGQTDCYDSTTGQVAVCSGIGHDGDHAGNQPNYSPSADGLTVTDNVTGLIWQQSTDITDDGIVDYDDKLYQDEAVAHCQGLVQAGRDDWRLPTIKEAYSLFLFSGEDPSGYQGTDTSALVLFLDEVFDRAFGDLDENERIIDGQYASSTLYLSTTMNGDPTMFGVNYVDGRIKGYPTHIKKYYVRCVTGNTSYGENDFADNGDQTVNDNATGLMWQQNDIESTNWDDAVEHCETTTTGLHEDWRLPDAKELQSILDSTISPATHGSAAIDPLFSATSFVNEAGETDWGSYWSSSTHVNFSGGGTNAAYVSFGRALGYVNGNVIDVHGAGAQRSDDKIDVAREPGAQSATGATGIFYYKGPQGDILRNNHMVRCVREIETVDADATGYTLFTPMQSTDTFLIDDLGEVMHTWVSGYRPGLSVYLLSNGELLRPGAITSRPSTFDGQFGGAAGAIEVLDWDSNVVWSTTVATENYLSHHDVEELPNGNILAVVWEAKSAAEAIAMGRTNVSGDTLWADAIYEICRSNAGNSCVDGEIVWSWSVWDHVVQDVDSAIVTTYVSDISEHPDKVDLNFFIGAGGSDWTHANSVDYNPLTDQILISVRSFNEYWVIDHGDAGQGIVSRVGNPAAYEGVGEQILFGQHDAQWIEQGLPGSGNILVFNNGANRPGGSYSSVDEFCHLGAGCTEGEMLESYSEGPGGDFFADHISGAQRLENGNTLVCEGTEGRLFEYDSSHEVVWEYDYGSEIFRASRYSRDYSGLSGSGVGESLYSDGFE